MVLWLISFVSNKCFLVDVSAVRTSLLRLFELFDFNLKLLLLQI